MKLLPLQMKETKFTAPTLLSEPIKQEKLLWGKECDACAKKRDQHEVDEAKTFATIFDQCDETMKSQPQCMNRHNTVDEMADVMALLKTIKNAMCDTSDEKCPAMQADVAWTQMLRAFQQEEDNLLDHHRRFKGVVKKVEDTHGKTEQDKADERDLKCSKDIDKTLEESKDEMSVHTFMDEAGRVHQPLLKNLEWDHSLEEGKRSATLEEAVQVLTASEDQHRLNKRCNRLWEPQDTENPGLSFVQKIESIEKQVCFKCQKPGHKSHQCKEN